MSRAQVEKFVTVISKDPAAFQEASKGATERAAFVENVVRYAKDKGYDFTKDEASTWITQFQQESADGELQDSQLEAVAGGGKGDAANSAQNNMQQGYNAASQTQSKFDNAAKNLINNMRHGFSSE